MYTWSLAHTSFEFGKNPHKPNTVFLKMRLCKPLKSVGANDLTVVTPTDSNGFQSSQGMCSIIKQNKKQINSYLISYVERYRIPCDWVNIVICFMKLFCWSNAIDFIKQSRITVPKMRPSQYYWQTGIATIQLKQPRFAKLIAIFKQPFICRFTWF